MVVGTRTNERIFINVFLNKPMSCRVFKVFMI